MDVIKIKIELMMYPSMGGGLLHHKSTGTEKIKLDKKNMHPEALHYIEDYASNSGFNLLSINHEQGAYYVLLIKE